MNRFCVPKDIYFGKGSLAQLSHLAGKRTSVVVGGRSMKRLGFLDKTLSHLEAAGMEVQVIDNVEPDPGLETVMRGKKAMQQFKPDWIIALGGGSVIDAAKAMWVFYEHPEIKFEQAIEFDGVPRLRQKASFVAIPSTSGTASEVTTSAVISNYSSRTKYALDSKELIPDIAILDSELAEAMPASIAAYTGMDALTHAVEALVATLANPFSNALATEAVLNIFEHLPESYAGNALAREKMHYAQCMAGMAFSNSMLGITHSMAHAVGLTFNIAHGTGNAIFLPYVIQFNQKTSAKTYARLAQRLNLPGHTEQELSQAFWQAVFNLNKELNLPASLQEYGVAKDLFERELAAIVQKAVADACTETNPRPCNEAEMEKLFQAAFYGRQIDF